jgi:hypothetical protein
MITIISRKGRMMSLKLPLKEIFPAEIIKEEAYIIKKIVAILK